MTDAQRSRNDTLSAYLAQAADDLSRSDQALGDDAEGLLFLGAWHQSYPAILVRDPFLSDSAKVQFLYLMQESAQCPRGAIAMPSLVQTGRVLGHSKKTVHRDRTLLRVCRWISQHKRVRDHQGRYCGSINAIHSEPCSLSEANRLDAFFLKLLQHAQEHTDRYIRRAANAALASIDQALQEGRDPLDPPDPMNRRLDAAKAVQNGGGSFFDLLIADGGSIEKPGESSAAGHTCGQQSNRTKFTPGAAKAGKPGVNFDVNQAGHTCDQLSNRAKFTPGGPSIKFTPGDFDPSAEFTHGYETTDIENKNDSYPQIEKFTPGPTSSSSKTTTTTDNRNSDSPCEHKRSGLPPGHSVTSKPESDSGANSEPSLRWPDALPANERALIGRSQDWQTLDGEQQQSVLDAMARKLQDPDNPVRSPVGYAVTLCKRAKSGTFQPVGAPPRKPKPGKPVEDNGPRSEMNNLRQQIQNMQSEIRGLEQDLIPYVDAARQPDLVAQRDRLRGECETLKRRYQALKDQIESSQAVRA